MVDELIIDEVLDACRFKISDIKPSQFMEERVIMPPGSAFPGNFSYNLTPYSKEPVDCIDPNHPARKIAIMKGGQIGLSSGLLRPAICFTISENPGNILFLIGNDNLVDDGMVQLDQLIDVSGIRHLIRSNVQRVKNSRTGDTNRRKEFFGGRLLAASGNNNKIIAQFDAMILIVDDMDLIKNKSSIDGDMRKLFEQRTAAYAHKSKTVYVSTPRVKSTSNIYPAFLQGDQRYFHIPCPHCGELIVYKWSTPRQDDPSKQGGISYVVDEKTGELITDSVGYVCQLCGKFFDESEKYERNLKGVWIPTAKPKEEGFYSYHISSLYAPPGMKNWTGYVRDFIEANPQGMPRKEAMNHTFYNLCLGEPYEPAGEEIKANMLMKNMRPYSVGIVPEDLSKQDGNGEIVMLTCAMDLNGRFGHETREDDVRLDYEVVAWCESGSSYSVQHGSIGTYVPFETDEQRKIPREKWTYEHNRSNSVWGEVDKLLNTEFPVDGGKRKMKILFSTMDTGYCEKQAFEYIDKNKFLLMGIKGNPEDKSKPLYKVTPNYKEALTKRNLYILDGHSYKEELAAYMRMNWSGSVREEQPTGFMNFPSQGLEVTFPGMHRSTTLYQYTNFFSHFEAEKRVPDLNENGEEVGFVWKKKSPQAQNHFWDCRIYNMAAKEIFMGQVFKEIKVKDNLTWTNFCRILLQK